MTDASRRLAAARINLLKQAEKCVATGRKLDAEWLAEFGGRVPRALAQLAADLDGTDVSAIETAARDLRESVTLTVDRMAVHAVDDPRVAFMRAALTLRQRLLLVDGAAADLAREETTADQIEEARP